MMGWDEAGKPRFSTLLTNRLEWVIDEGYLEKIK
jgi:hypothetical protein